MSNINSNFDKWTKYFLNIAKLTASKSKDTSTKVGAVITDSNNRISSTGYNGFPTRVKDSKDRIENREIKYKLTLHAELNAILFSNKDLSGHILYCTHPPCVSCACAIIQVGIVKVICVKPNEDMVSRWGDDFELSKKILKESGVLYFEVDEKDLAILF